MKLLTLLTTFSLFASGSEQVDDLQFDRYVNIDKKSGQPLSYSLKFEPSDDKAEFFLSWSTQILLYLKSALEITNDHYNKEVNTFYGIDTLMLSLEDDHIRELMFSGQFPDFLNLHHIEYLLSYDANLLQKRYSKESIELFKAYQSYLRSLAIDYYPYEKMLPYSETEEIMLPVIIKMFKHFNMMYKENKSNILNLDRMSNMPAAEKKIRSAAFYVYLKSEINQIALSSEDKHAIFQHVKSCTAEELEKIIYYSSNDYKDIKNETRRHRMCLIYILPEWKDYFKQWDAPTVAKAWHDYIQNIYQS